MTTVGGWHRTTPISSAAPAWANAARKDYDEALAIHREHSARARATWQPIAQAVEQDPRDLDPVTL
jgi:hypothetical protein